MSVLSALPLALPLAAVLFVAGAWLARVEERRHLSRTTTHNPARRRRV